MVPLPSVSACMKAMRARPSRSAAWRTAWCCRAQGQRAFWGKPRCQRARKQARARAQLPHSRGVRVRTSSTVSGAAMAAARGLRAARRDGARSRLSHAAADDAA
jgi:hypothetical protein